MLIEALAWIRQFRDRYIIIKLGGSALENPEAVKSFLTDVIFLETVGMRPVVIHGGGKRNQPGNGRRWHRTSLGAGATLHRQEDA